MIRIGHFSDLHYADGPKFAEADRCLSYAIDTAIAEGIQCAVFTGDATDHALDVHSPAVVALARNVRRLTEHCPVLMLQGTFSHEPPGTLSIFRLLGGRFPVHVADRISQVALMPDGQWLCSDSWAFDAVPAGAGALFSCVPTVNKAVIGALVGGTAAAEAVGEQLGNLLAGFAPINAAARAAGVPTVGLSHGTVYGCMTEHDVPMAGMDHEFTTGALFAAGASAFMVGHIHKHQSWEAGGRQIAYAGSIGRLHYGEVGEKGFLVWSVGSDGASFELVPTPSRRTIEITFDGPPDMNHLRARAARADTEGAFVRVRWVVPEEERHTVDRDAIEKLFAGRAVETKIEGRIVPVVRARAAGISHLSSVTDKVVMWAGTTGVDAAPLVEALTELGTDTPEAIIERILDPAGEARVAVIPAAVGADAPGQPSHGTLESLDLF